MTALAGTVALLGMLAFCALSLAALSASLLGCFGQFARAAWLLVCLPKRAGDNVVGAAIFKLRGLCGAFGACCGAAGAKGAS